MATEKRFSYEIENFKEELGQYNRSGLVKLLLMMKEENERLKKERNHFERKKTEYLTEWNTCRIQNTELKKDNNELKEAMKRMMIEMMGGKMND